MAKRKVTLIFPKELIKEPVIYRTAKEYDIIPNIRRARITEEVGEVVLELEGAEDNLTRSMEYLLNIGVKVEPVEGDILE